MNAPLLSPIPAPDQAPSYLLLDSLEFDVVYEQLDFRSSKCVIQAAIRSQITGSDIDITFAETCILNGDGICIAKANNCHFRAGHIYKVGHAVNCTREEGAQLVEGVHMTSRLGSKRRGAMSSLVSFALLTDPETQTQVVRANVASNLDLRLKQAMRLYRKYIDLCDDTMQGVGAQEKTILPVSFKVTAEQDTCSSQSTQSSQDTEMSQPEKDNVIENLRCMVCVSKLANAFFLPCGHLCYCMQCAHASMKEDKLFCPICRGFVQECKQVNNYS